MPLTCCGAVIVMLSVCCVAYEDLVDLAPRQIRTASDELGTSLSPEEVMNQNIQDPVLSALATH